MASHRFRGFREALSGGDPRAMTHAAMAGKAPMSPRRLRVVHAVETMELGGMERMIATLAQVTDRERFDVHVLCIKGVGRVGEALAGAGIPVHNAGLRPASSDYFGFLPLARILRRLRADVVHTHNTCALLFAAPGAWLAGVRTIVHTEHGRAFPDRAHIMAAERAAATVVDHVVGVSEAMTDALHRYERIPRRKLRTIANGVEASRDVSRRDRSRALEGLEITAGARLVGTAARLVWEKGHTHLLEAWRVVHEAEPEALLLIAGDGPERPALEALADSLGIRNSVRFLGTREDVPALLHSLEVFVMPSVSEGLPLALLEAMSTARPVIVSDIGGMPDALGDGKAGLIVPPADPAALAAAILQLLRDPAFAEALGAEAAARFRERYTAGAMAHAYEALYMGGASA